MRRSRPGTTAGAAPTYSKNTGTTPDLGGLARGRPDDPPAFWRAPRDSRAYVSTPPPALLRLLFYATSCGRRRKCRHLRGVLYHSNPAPCRSTGTNSRPQASIPSATNTWLLPREVGPSSDMEDRVPQSRAKPRVTPLVTISDWRYLLRRHHVTTPALWAGRLSLKGPCLRIDRKTAGLSRHRTTRRAPARRRPGPAPIVVGSRWRVGRPRSRFPRRRRRGLHDGVAMNAPRSCCSDRRRRAGLGRRTGASGRRAVPRTARKVQAGESRIGADAALSLARVSRAAREV